MSGKLTEAAAGVFPIAPTPFDATGAIDWPSVDSMVEFYLGCGAHGLTILGIMGEAPKLTHDESLAVAQRVLERVKGRVPVIVGVSAPGFASMTELAKRVMGMGAAGVMVAPTGALKLDEQVEGYFAQAIEALGSEIPVVVQDYPPTTGIWTSVPVLLRLIGKYPQIVMFKHEDNPSLKKLSRFRSDAAAAGVRRVSVLVGAGGLYYVHELRRGADGAMTGYAFPEMLVAVRDHVLAGRDDAADALFEAHLPLIVMECQPGIGLAVRKEVLVRRGAIRSAALRAPGPRLDAADIAEIERTLARLSARIGGALKAA